VRVRDALSGDVAELRARLFVNAAGPWADRLLELVSGGAASHKLIRSKGIHIVTRALTNGHALTVSHKGGHFFVLPWREHTIIGTTDSVFTGSPDELRVAGGEIDTFLALVNEGLPSLRLARDDVVYAYAGLRPLVDDGAKNSYTASRRAEIVDHAGEGGPANLLSAIGGKWTTSRDIAEKCVNLIAEKLGAALKPCDTADAALPGATGQFRLFVERLMVKHRQFSPSIVHNLARNYGARVEEALTPIYATPALARCVSQRLPDIAAQVVFAVRSEMAMTLDDVMFRRTGLGSLGPLEPRAVAEVAAIMGAELGWSEDEKQRQIASIGWRYEALARAS
jgi:glycerol-3-phosphate dehydrogenase